MSTMDTDTETDTESDTETDTETDTPVSSKSSTSDVTYTSAIGIRKRRRLRQQRKRLRERNKKLRRLENLSKEKEARTSSKVTEVQTSSKGKKLNGSNLYRPPPSDVKVIPKNLGLCDICLGLYNKKHMDRHKSVCDGSGKWCRYQFT